MLASCCTLMLIAWYSERGGTGSVHVRVLLVPYSLVTIMHTNFSSYLFRRRCLANFKQLREYTFYFLIIEL